MKQLRYIVPFLSLIALISLFFKLPNCTTCHTENLLLPFLGIGYFSILFAISLLFPIFPKGTVGWIGLIGSILLPISLIWLDGIPNCLPCFIAHAANIGIWAIWLATPPLQIQTSTPVTERLCLALIVPIAVISLFGFLNLSLPKKRTFIGLSVGETVPVFSYKTLKGAQIANSSQETLLINFIAPNCPFCKEQLQILNALAAELPTLRWVNVSPVLPQEWVAASPTADWIEDKEGGLRNLFKVYGTPTLFILGSNGKIATVVPGVPEQMKDYLLKALSREKE